MAGADDPGALVNAVYNNARLQGDSDQLAYQKAVAALNQSNSYATNFGQSFGFYTDLNQAAAAGPPKGTPTLQAGGMTGSIGYIPGYTGVDAGQTMGNLAGMASTAQGGAGLTGFYVAPRQSAYTPGTFLRIDPATYDAQRYGDTQLDYVLSSGQLQRVTIPQAKAMGWDGDLGKISGTMIPFSTAATLESAPPSQLPQQTLASLSAYSNLNTAAINQALAQAGATGMYTTPQTIYAPGTNVSGGKFSDIPADQQQAYYYSHGGDWQAAMNAWVADSNNAIRQSIENAGGTWDPNAPGGDANNRARAQETLAAQQQYFQQAYNLANQFGTYYAPGAPGQAGVAGTNMPTAGQKTMAQQEQDYTQWLRSQQESRAQWTAQQQASQNYLDLLSRLRGPADYARYQQVLGATPQGTRDLVAAAAGQYIPGGGATTGVQPQAANLNTLYNQATGADTSGQQALSEMQRTLVAPNQMAPQTWNALTPSQQQMLLGVWESQGYTQDDAKALFQQALPKYATQAPAAGSFRLQ